jgi:serine O-acetyltransferase
MAMNEALNSDLERLIKDVLASYESDERTQRIGEEFLPSRSRIVEILDQVRGLLFPGYFGDKKLTRENVKFHVGNLLSKLGADLTEQINHCMCSERGCQTCEEAEQCYQDAGRIAHAFLERIPRLREMLAMDAQAAYDGDPAAKSIDEVIYCYPGFYAVTVYRIAHELSELGVPLMPRIMTEYAHSITGTDIHPGAKIGKSFFIDHATGVVVGETTEIGDNVKIYQGVTLGAYSFPKDERGRVIKGLKRHPTIEDNVTIYANATLLGGDTVVGKGAEVGGNTWVKGSIKPGSMVTSDLPKLRVRTQKKPGE